MSGPTKSIAGLVAQWEAAAGGASGTPPEALAATGEGPKDPRQCLIEMLEVAAQLEFATIPPYLCALWSIENELDPAAESIREVVQEEMLHLALVCNLLVALGAEVKLREWAPRYPRKLPGEVHQDLIVSLRKFDRDSLLGFIQIESPEKRPDNVDIEHGDPYWEGGKTIGALYEIILAAFRHLKPPLQTDRQVTGPLSWRSVATLADVEWAIRIIQHQGEGAVIGPLDSSQADLAHYYRFLELYKEKRLRFDKEEGRFYWRGKITRPKCQPMAEVPEGGYPQPIDPQAARHMKQFDKAYHRMLVELENAWAHPAQNVITGQGALVSAYVSMFDLGKHARTLMTIPTGAKDGSTYGPLFTPPLPDGTVRAEPLGPAPPSSAKRNRPKAGDSDQRSRKK